VRACKAGADGCAELRWPTAGLRIVSSALLRRAWLRRNCRAQPDTFHRNQVRSTGGDRAGDGGGRDGRLRMATLINGRDADRSTGSALMRSDAPALRPAHTSKSIERRSGAHRAPNERRSGAHRASTSRHIHAYIYTGIEHQQLRHKAFDKPS
jgi:hypothetical protein